MTETAEAFMKVVEFIKTDCGKFTPGQCLTCEFLDRTFKRCMMISLFHEPNSYSEQEIRDIIEKNEVIVDRLKKQGK